MSEGKTLQLQVTPVFDRMRRAVADPRYHVFVLEGGSRCFSGDTLVVTEQGSKAISEVQKGERVKCLDADGNEVYSVVKDVFRYPVDKPMVEIRLKNGKTIRCSADHKFLFNGEYVPIIEILHSIILQARGYRKPCEIRQSDILSWEYIPPHRVSEVYDVEVETYHNYFIDAGGQEYNVHNSSKTHSLIQFFIFFALSHTDRKYRIVISRKKSTWLNATVWVDFDAILAELGFLEKRDFVKNKSLHSITICTTSFEFIGLDDVQKLHGLTTDIFWINEAMEASKDDFDQLEQRTKMFSVLDYNPSAEEHWIYDNVCPRDDCYFDHSTMLDNPFIPENSRRKILSYEPTEYNIEQGTADERKWKIYGLGMRSAIEGLVFKSYEIISKIPEEVDKRWYCVDFGYSMDETAIAEVGYYNKNLYIQEHCYKTGMLTDEIARELLKLQAKRRLAIISESADPRLVKELRNYGLPIVPVTKYPGSIEAGIDFMQGCKIHITEDSLNAKMELDNYTYQQDKNGKWLNIPVDAYCHLIDGVRYIVLEAIMAKNGKGVDLNRVAAAIHR